MKKERKFLKGRSIADIAAAKPKPGVNPSSASAALGPAPTPDFSSSAEASGSRSKPKKKSPKKKKGGNRRKMGRTDFKEKAPAGTGPKASKETQLARKAASEFEMRTLSVGSLARNICSSLMAKCDFDQYPFKSPQFFVFFHEQRVLAEKIANRIRECVETAQLYQKTIYEIMMLAIDDIKDPTRLQRHSRLTRRIPPWTESDSKSDSESVSFRCSTRDPSQLPEIYDDDFIDTLLDQKVIYGLSSLVFFGENQASKMSAKEPPVERYTSTRGFTAKKKDYSKYYAWWIFQRYKYEAKFVPFKKRGIRIIHAEATRSAAQDVLEAINNHYKFAVVSIAYNIPGQ